MMSAYKASKIEMTQTQYNEYITELRARHKMFEDRKLFKKLRETVAHCECCGKTKLETTRLEVHHIIPRRFDECTNNEDNLIVLCPTCHRRLEFIIGFNEDTKTIVKKTNNFLEKHKCK